MRGIVIRTFVTAAAAVTLALGAAQLSAGTALAAPTVQSAPAAAQTAVQANIATHWITYSTEITSYAACVELGNQIVENHVLGALDYICTPTPTKSGCSTFWTLDLELPGAAVSKAPPAQPAC